MVMQAEIVAEIRRRDAAEIQPSGAACIGPTLMVAQDTNFPGRAVLRRIAIQCCRAGGLWPSLFMSSLTLVQLEFAAFSGASPV